MELSDLVVSDPEIMSGAPCFRGTRVPVALLFENLGAGMSVEEILDTWPSLERDEGVPKPVVLAFRQGETVTVVQIGWRGTKNGRLIREAEAHGFEVSVTTDEHMRHQNSLAGYRLAVVVLPYTHWPSVRGMLGEIAAAVAGARPGTFTDVGRP